MKKIRLGFIGTGNMGQMAHLRNYLTLPDCVVAMKRMFDAMQTVFSKLP